ncbi:hypothetical protein R3P38DRAFT_2850942 [Favolaschia claudopus]|uniref:F-box domain-containing protein n=1 Tax=Favolaschia claudopus TaxID=2862362 RepID=A0AAW0DNQ6_9AGAR
MVQDTVSDPESLAAGLTALDLASNTVHESDLPPEIISDIFILCLPVHGRVKPAPGTAPLLLAQICRRWREIALDTRQIWCSIYLEIPRESSRWDTYSQTALRLLQTWIPRAKGYPLSLGLDRDHLLYRPERRVPRIQYHEKGISTQLLHFLSTYAMQISRFEARVSDSQFDQIFPPNTWFPLQQSLHIPRCDETRLWNILHNSSSLRDLRFYRYMPQYRYSLITITTLDAGNTDFSAGYFFYMLNQFVDLQRLKCAISNNQRKALIWITPTPHQQLAVLKLNKSNVLAKAVLPNLHDLQITDDDSESPFREILSLVTRSSCALSSLGMCIGDATSSEFYDFLAALPALESLDIQDCDNIDQTLNTILRPLTHLRRLTSLSVRAGFLSPSSLDFELLSVLLRTRDQAAKGAHPIAKLQSLHITMTFRRRIVDEQWSLDDYRHLITPRESASDAEVFKTLVANSLDLLFTVNSTDGEHISWPKPLGMIDPLGDKW